MDWNALITSLGNSIPVIVVLGYAWMREAKRADEEARKRDADNKSWADRFTDLTKAMAGASGTLPAIDLEKRLS